MRRLALLAAAFGLLATIGSTGARAAGHPGQLGQMRACTTGQLRCGAIVVTRGGRVLRTATPAALPAGFGPADYHKAYALPTTGATVRVDDVTGQLVTVAGGMEGRLLRDDA